MVVQSLARDNEEQNNLGLIIEALITKAALFWRSWKRNFIVYSEIPLLRPPKIKTFFSIKNLILKL